MDCKTVLEQLPAYADSGARNREQIALHLQQCEACRAEQAAWIQMVGHLKQIDVPDPGEAFFRRFTLSVEHAIAQETPPPKGWRIWERFEFPPLFPSFRWAMAAVAGVMIVVGVVRFTGWRTAPQPAIRPDPFVSLETVVHSANWSNQEETELFFDVMEEEAEDLEMDVMIGMDI